jgi:putative PIN family toxin of toxin-antitoxin system
MGEIRLDVVFDCNVFAQAMINPKGPGGRCVASVLAGRLRLFWSDYVLAEIRRIAVKPTPRKLGVTPELIDRFLTPLLPVVVRVAAPPSIYQHPFDPKDSHYIDLAVATNSSLIASSDKHLLNLMKLNRPEGGEFRRRFPALEVLSPWELIQRLER